ncbi:MAG: hypothetical protein AAF503_10110 [Pseudomonadota bacterium]
MRKTATTMIFAAVLCLAGPAGSQTVVNGRLLSPAEVSWFSRMSCGPIWPGNYWYDVASGYWGYAGRPTPIGHIRDRCLRAPQPRKSLSERRQLYRPGEILGGY